MKKWLRKKVPGFTLVEMLVVLLIISVLLIIFIPQVKDHYKKIETTGDDAIMALVSSQQEMCLLTKNEHEEDDRNDLNGIVDPTKIEGDILVKHGHIDKKQEKRYEEAKARQKNE